MGPVVWFLMLTVVHTNGNVESVLNYSLDPQYNNEKSCNEAGDELANKKQLEIGLNNAKVFYRCEPILFDDIKKAIGKTGTGT